MYGLENISANNGWAISFIGISIVFLGLTLLASTIAQLHKILDLWDNRKELFKKPEPIETAPVEAPAVDKANKLEIEQLPPGEREIVRQYKMLADRLGEPLSLPELLKLAQKVGIESPHSNLNRLLRKKVIVADQNGYFKWSL